MREILKCAYTNALFLRPCVVDDGNVLCLMVNVCVIRCSHDGFAFVLVSFWLFFLFLRCEHTGRVSSEKIILTGTLQSVFNFRALCPARNGTSLRFKLRMAVVFLFFYLFGVLICIVCLISERDCIVRAIVVVSPLFSSRILKYSLSFLILITQYIKQYNNCLLSIYY